MDASPLLIIFGIATALVAGAYAWIDRKMKFTNPSVKGAYKAGLVIIYGLQLVILVLFLL